MKSTVEDKQKETLGEKEREKLLVCRALEMVVTRYHLGRSYMDREAFVKDMGEVNVPENSGMEAL